MAELLRTQEVVVTDPGADDAVAILVGWSALKSPAMVATFGNASTVQTGRNLNALLHFENGHRKPGVIKPEPTIFIGADRAINTNEPFDLDVQFVHGEGGMEGVGIGFPPIRTKSSDLYKDMPGPVDIFSFGAVTEVLEIIDGQGGLRNSVKSLTLMGGAFVQMGNTDMHQEANLRHDPFALQEVVRHFTENEIPITFVPLDVTQEEAIEFSVDRAVALAESLSKRGSKNVATYLLRLVGPESTYARFYRSVEGVYDLRGRTPELKRFGGPSIHDLTALMVKLHPEIFEFREYPIKVGDDGVVGISMAHMRVDGKVNVAMALKQGGAEKYWDLTESYLASHYN